MTTDTFTKDLDDLYIPPADNAVIEPYTLPKTGARKRRASPSRHHQTTLALRPSSSSDASLSDARPENTESSQGSINSSPSSVDSLVPTYKAHEVQLPVPKRRRTATGKKSVGKIESTMPKPAQQPLVWANGRQALCESMEFFKSHQAGIYMQSKIAKGLLVDGSVAFRDVSGGKVIITTCGGGREKSDEGKSVHCKDQLQMSTSAEAFNNSKETKTPVLIIFGKGNTLLRAEMPHAYNVAGYGHVTDVWCEREGGTGNGYMVWMVRIEMINLDEAPWWLPADPLNNRPEDLSVFPMTVPSVKVCTVCHQSSKEMYNEGWSCVNNTCPKYFVFGRTNEDLNGNQIDDSSIPISMVSARQGGRMLALGTARDGTPINPKTLRFADAFLAERTRFPGIYPLPDIKRAPMTDAELSHGKMLYAKRTKEGLACQKCGCCSRMILWNKWICEDKANSGCDWEYTLDPSSILVSDAIAEAAEEERKFKKFVGDGVEALPPRNFGGYKVWEYKLPSGEPSIIAGRVLIFKSTKLIQQQDNGPDALFHDFQNNDLNMRRNGAFQTGAKLEALTNHWSANWGAPYKFRVRNDSKPFRQAPDAIIRSLKMLTWAGEEAVRSSTTPSNGTTFLEFNELLSLAYRESSMMKYHDDGEKQLGDTVASLSLGASAKMMWRAKSHNSIGVAGKGVAAVKPACLELILEHGDIMVMQGAPIQKLYEHQVIPHGMLRFALTARYVVPEMLKTISDREWAIQAATLPDGHQRWDYNGN